MSNESAESGPSIAHLFYIGGKCAPDLRKERQVLPTQPYSVVYSRERFAPTASTAKSTSDAVAGTLSRQFPLVDRPSFTEQPLLTSD